MTSYSVTTAGIRSTESKEKYIRLSDDESVSLIVPLRAFAGNGAEAINILKNQGMPIIGTKECTALISKVSNIYEFEPVPIIEKIGWNGGSFAIQSGRVFSPSGTPSPEVAIHGRPRKCEFQGRLAQWNANLSDRIEDQPILRFFVMLMFAASILRLTEYVGNLAFEIVGPKGTGKSSVQRLMSSVAGGAGQGPEGHYYEPFDSTLLALEDAMDLHSDLPLVLDEANLFSSDGTPRALAEKFKALAFKLWSGTTRSRLGSPASLENRLVTVITANEPLSSLIGENSDSALAAADRLLTVPISAARPFGVLDSVPDTHTGPAAFIDDLLRGVSETYGVALPHFLQGLVNDRAEAEDDLRRSIADYMAEFRDRAGITGNSGSEVRVANAFAIPYAAGKLAQAYGTLPEGFRCGDAAMTCYRLHVDRHLAGLSFRERILALSNRAEVPQLGSGKLRSLTESEFAVGMYIREGREGRELLIRADKIGSYIENWSAIRSRDEVQSLITSENGRQRIRRKICADHPKARVFSFKLPD